MQDMDNTTNVATLERLPKHARIRRELHTQIRAKAFVEGGHFYTEKQICRNFGVGSSTAKRVLNDMQDQGIVERRRGAGTFLAKDAISRMTTALKTIGILLYDESNPLVPGMVQIIGGVQEVARQRKYDLKILISTSGEVTRLVRDARVDGLIVGYQELPEAQLKELASICPALVALNRAIDLEDVHTVCANHLLTMLLIGEHLDALKHKRLAFLHGPCHFEFTHEYLRGYDLIRDRFGFAGDDSLVIETGTHQQGTLICAAPPARDKLSEVRRLLERGDRPTAVIVPTHAWANALMKMAADMGIAVPDELSIVLLTEPDAGEGETITHVRQDSREFGRCTGRVLIELMDDNTPKRKNTFVKPELVVGTTTAPAGGPNQ